MAYTSSNQDINGYASVPNTEKCESCRIDKDLTWKIWKTRRYVVAVLSAFGMANSYFLRGNMSIAVVAMTENRTVVNPNGNVTYERDFDWDFKIQGFILSAFFYGYISTQLLGGWIASRIGGKRVFAVGIGGAALSTLIIPLVAGQTYYSVMILRIINGTFAGVSYPCVLEIWSRWAPPSERSILLSITCCGSSLGSVLAMVLCAYLSKAFGWHSIFYVSGAIGLLWAFIWWIFIADTPNQDRFITHSERQYINSAVGNQHRKSLRYPWKRLLTSPPIIACIVASFVDSWGLYTLLTQLPTFMKDVLHFDLGKTGLMSALPHLSRAVILLTSGYLLDRFRSTGVVTTTQARKISCCGGLLALAVCLLVAMFLLTPIGTTVCFIIGTGLGGLALGGYGANYLDVAPQYSGMTAAIGNSISTLAGIASPILTGYIVTNGNTEEWRIVFFIVIGVLLIGVFIYGLFASAELQSWAKEPEPVILLPVRRPLDAEPTKNDI